MGFRRLSIDPRSKLSTADLEASVTAPERRGSAFRGGASRESNSRGLLDSMEAERRESEASLEEYLDPVYAEVKESRVST